MFYKKKYCPVNLTYNTTKNIHIIMVNRILGETSFTVRFRIQGKEK